MLIRQFDEQGGWELPGLCSCAHWLNFKCGIGMNAAREKVRVARALKDLPKISAAFERGGVSYSKVRAMTRVAHADNEGYLLMIAGHGSAWHVETLIAKYRRASHQTEAAMALEEHENRECSYYYDHDGCLVIKARYPADQGAVVLRALAGDSTTSATADRFQVVVHVSAETLQSVPNDDATARPLGLAEMSYLENGPHVSEETSRRVACDGGIVKLVENDDGVPLSVGRKSRAIPPAIRRALQARDGGCRFPGCSRTRFVDGHHIEHWADGGETSLDNLVLLCRHHHRLVHEGGYYCTRRTGGSIAFLAPFGDDLSAQRQSTSISNHNDVIRWFDRYMPDLEVDSETCVSRWYAGERMDWDLAVASMFRQSPDKAPCESDPRSAATGD